MTTRATTPLERNGLKTALKRLITALGGIDAAASCTRLERSAINQAGDVNLPDRHLPIDVLLDLERIAGTPFVTQQLAAGQGYLLLPTNIGEGDIAAMLSVVAADAGKTMADAVQAIRNDLPDAERATLLADLAELARAAQLAMGALQPNREGATPIALGHRATAPPAA